MDSVDFECSAFAITEDKRSRPEKGEMIVETRTGKGTGKGKGLNTCRAASPGLASASPPDLTAIGSVRQGMPNPRPSLAERVLGGLALWGARQESAGFASGISVGWSTGRSASTRISVISNQLYVWFRTHSQADSPDHFQGLAGEVDQTRNTLTSNNGSKIVLTSK